MQNGERMSHDLEVLSNVDAGNACRFKQLLFFEWALSTYTRRLPNWHRNSNYQLINGNRISMDRNYYNGIDINLQANPDIFNDFS